MRNAQNTPASLLDYPINNTRRISEWIQDFWDSKQPVHLIWLGQFGQILFQSLFLALFHSDPFHSLVSSHLPTMADPEPTLVSELLIWGVLGLPLFTPLILLPLTLWRIHAIWPCGEKWKPILITIGLVVITWVLSGNVLFLMILNFD